MGLAILSHLQAALAPRLSRLKCSNQQVARLDNFRLVVFRAVARHLSFRKAAEELYLGRSPQSANRSKRLKKSSVCSSSIVPGPRFVSPPPERSCSSTPSNQAMSWREPNSRSQPSERIAGRPADPRRVDHYRPVRSARSAQRVLPDASAHLSHPRQRQYRAHRAGAPGPFDCSRLHRRAAAQPRCESRTISAGRTRPDRARSPRVGRTRIRSNPPRLAGAPLLMRERGSGTRSIIEQALDRAGVKKRSLRVVMELDSTEAIKSSVEAGFGVGFVSRWAIAKDLRLGRTFKIIEVEGLRLRRPFLIVSTRGTTLQPVTEEFRRFLFARASRPA